MRIFFSTVLKYICFYKIINLNMVSIRYGVMVMCNGNALQCIIFYQVMLVMCKALKFWCNASIIWHYIKLLL
jgi:hypothetical protein